MSIILWIILALYGSPQVFTCSTALAHSHNDIREGKITITTWSGCTVVATINNTPVQLWADAQRCTLTTKVPGTFLARWDNTCKQLLELTDGPALSECPATTPTPTPTPIPTPTSQPAVQPSIDGAKGITITDAQGGIWTIGTIKNETLRNKVWIGGGQTTEYKYLNKEVYAKGFRDGLWYKWTSSTWDLFGSSEPGGPAPAPSPSPTPVTQNTKVVDWPRENVEQWWAQIMAEGWKCIPYTDGGRTTKAFCWK